MASGAPTVLLVDDEPDVCWALERLLRASGIVSVATTSGREALRLAGEAVFDLAFIDAKLPDSQGLEIARRMREITPALRIVLISAYFYRDDGEIVEALAARVIDDFVSKPFRHDEIRSLLRERQPRR